MSNPYKDFADLLFNDDKKINEACEQILSMPPEQLIKLMQENNQGG